ncbi:MAG: 16S rRNA (adenine(1518)-N(6)/adenine(1519)-N(6))-dimethyltransferase RsmA [Candidatus Thorarchaeota archaeon]
MSPLSDNLKFLLQKYSIRPTKKLGQSFLTDTQIARRITDVASITEKDDVLEIGGGVGALTKWIAKKAGRVFVVEVDKGLVQALKSVLSEYSNVEIIEGDALVVELPVTNKIVSNLPYSISSEVTFRILNTVKPDVAILMYQKEFAQRLLAKPGSREYSRLTVDFRYLADVEHVMDVPANSFYPIPAVDSTVVRIVPRITGQWARDFDVFDWMIRGIYSYPNKQIRKALKIWFRNLGVEKAITDELLSRCNDVITGKERLRTLPQKTLVEIADKLLSMVDDGLIQHPRSRQL